MAVYRYRTLRRVLITAMWTAIVLIYLFPYTWMVMTGFRDPIDTLTMPPRLIFRPTLDGFRYIFTNTGFQHYLVNSIIVSVSATTLIIVIASLAAYALAHLTARRGFLLAILVTRMGAGRGGGGSVLSRHLQGRPARHLSRPDHHIHGVQPAVCNLAVAQLLP